MEIEQINYTLPDGNVIKIGPARFRAPEILFKPDIIGEECEGLHEVLMFSIQKSDLDLRKVLFKNIVLSGGSTLFKGFGDRLLSEIKKMAPKETQIKVSSSSNIALSIYERPISPSEGSPGEAYQGQRITIPSDILSTTRTNSVCVDL